MNRRQFAFAALITAGMTGCDSEPKPDHTATLLHRQDVHKAFSDLAKSIDDLDELTGDFDFEKCSKVVPRVKEATNSVVNDLAELKRVLGYPIEAD